MADGVECCEFFAIVIHVHVVIYQYLGITVTCMWLYINI